MDPIKTQVGTLLTCDFQENTITFLMEEDFKVRAGKFALVDIDVYEKMLSVLKATKSGHLLEGGQIKPAWMHDIDEILLSANID